MSNSYLKVLHFDLESSFERNPNHAIIIAFSNIGIGVSILLFILYAEGDANVFCQFEVIDVARLVELAHRSGI